MTQLHHLSALEQLAGMRRGDYSPRDLTEHYLERIARLDAALGAFVVVTADAARERADGVAAASRALPLWGLPLADKDLVARAGVPTRHGSRALADNVPGVSDELATVLDDAGAVSLGKTATPEFGLSGYTEPLAGPVARNPYDTRLGAGGSSGGAAAAVAAGLLPLAPGSDGGGSVRIPAAACGLVGLKPSRGRVPAKSGFEGLAGLSVAGPLARTVADAALLLDALLGEGRDVWATRPPTWDGGPFLNAAVRGEGRYSIGVTRNTPWEASHPVAVAPEAEAALAVAIRELDALGHGVEEVRLEPEDGYAAAFGTIWQAGAAQIPVEDAALDLVEPLTRWLVDRGRVLTARVLADALVWLAGYERRLIRQLAPFDAVLTPALAVPPPAIGWYDTVDPERNFAQQILVTPFTSMVNVAGLPAIALPVSATPGGVPMGVQLIGRPGGEDVLLALGAQLERRLSWDRRHPSAWDE
jgi:amidase